MTKEELQKHGSKYSQTYKSGFGLWKDDFDAMASKTVLKLLLSKFAPLSIEMQKAVISDQAVINNWETGEVDYVDNKAEEVDIEDLKQLFLDKGDFLPAEEQIAIERIIKNEEKDSYKKALTLLNKL
jgi:recombination protein RecT